MYFDKPLQKLSRVLMPWVLIPTVLSLSGEGFRNSAPGAYGLGQSGGRIAFIDDASAVMHNPANLSDLAGEEIDTLFAPTAVHIATEFEQAGGGRGETEEPVKFLPNFFLTAPSPNKDLAFGLAVTVPYGLSTKWETRGVFGPGGSLRYLAPHESEMLTVQINPVVSYRIHDQLSVAFGLSALYSKLRFQQYFPAVPGLVSSETVAEAEMDGWGFGVNGAVTWDITPKDRLALTLRSESSVDHKGDSQIGKLTLAALGFGFTERGSAATRVTYPWIVGFAYGRQLTDALQLELQYERVGFSNFEALDIDLANNNPLFAGANITAQNWNDSYTLGLGLRYDHGDGLRTHVSCQYFESPVPDETLSTTIPDADQIALTIGMTKRWEQVYAGIAYSYVDYEERETVIVPGKLQTRLHLLALNFGWRF